MNRSAIFFQCFVFVALYQLIAGALNDQQKQKIVADKLAEIKAACSTPNCQAESYNLTSYGQANAGKVAAYGYYHEVETNGIFDVYKFNDDDAFVPVENFDLAGFKLSNESGNQLSIAKSGAPTREFVFADSSDVAKFKQNLSKHSSQ